MRIVLDARKYFDFGIGTYIQNLVPHIGSRCELVLLLAPEEAERISLPSSIRKVMNSSGKYSIGELRSIAKDTNRLKADVFHAPHYTTPYGLKMPCVTTIHDILHVSGNEYFSFPKRVYARTIISHACRVSAAIIVDSEFTKQELLDTFHLNDTQVHVIHLGVSSIFSAKYSEKSVREFRNKYHLTKPTILYTGSLKPHKNIEVLIRAFAHMKQRSDLQLVFSGESITRKNTLWKLVKENKITKDVVEIGQISRRELALAYRAASVVVLPSLYEGFGFSVLEAMASGIPAIGARAGSIPEVMGDGGILFDPHSVEDLTHALEKVLNDTEYRLAVIKKGFRNVKRFSWDKCAEQTFQIYMDVV
jgi:glycosyltransferase involved in cell wall biosynthesis